MRQAKGQARTVPAPCHRRRADDGRTNEPANGIDIGTGSPGLVRFGSVLWSEQPTALVAHLTPRMLSSTSCMPSCSLTDILQ